VDPAAPWLEDARGVPTPLFHDVPVHP